MVAYNLVSMLGDAGQYLTFEPTTNYSKDCEVEFAITVEAAASSYPSILLLGSSTDSAEHIYFDNDTFRVGYQGAVSFFPLPAVAGVGKGTRNVYKVKLSAGVLSVWQNGVKSVTEVTGITKGFTLSDGDLLRSNSEGWALEYFKFTSVDFPDDSRWWVLDETKGEVTLDHYNDKPLTLVGFPVDSGYVRGVDGDILGYRLSEGVYASAEPWNPSALGFDFAVKFIAGDITKNLVDGNHATGIYLRVDQGTGDVFAWYNNQKLYGVSAGKYTFVSGVTYTVKATVYNDGSADVKVNDDVISQVPEGTITDISVAATNTQINRSVLMPDAYSNFLLLSVEINDHVMPSNSRLYDATIADSKKFIETVQSKHADILNSSSVKWQPILPVDYFIIGLESHHDFANLKSFIDTRAAVTSAWQFAAMDYLQVGNGGGTLWHTNADNKVILGAVKGKEFDGNKATAVGYDAGPDAMQFLAPLFMQGVYFNPKFSAAGTAAIYASNCLLDQVKRVRTAKNCVVKNAQSYAQIKANNTIFLESVSSNGNTSNYVDLTNCILLKASNAVKQVNATVSHSLFAQSDLSGVETSIGNIANVDFTGAFVDSANDDWRINQAWADINAASNGVGGTAIASWAYFTLDTMLSVYADLDIRLATLDSVFSDVEIQGKIFNALTSVIADLELKHQIYEAILADVDLRQAIYGITLADLDLHCGIYGSTAADVGFRYAIFGSAYADASFNFAMAGSVAADLAVQFHLLASVVSDVDLRAQILRVVESNIEIQAQILASVSADIEIQHFVYAAAIADLDIEYQVFGKKRPISTGKVSFSYEVLHFSFEQENTDYSFDLVE